MACALRTRAHRPNLLSLPVSLRTATYQTSRCFSATPARQLSLLDIAITPPTYLLDSLHAAGLPWCAVLPTTALLVRGVLVYYTSIRPARASAQIHANLIPLASARARAKIHGLDAQEARKDMPALFQQLDMIFSAWWVRQMELHRLGKMFGAPRFRPTGLVNFGMLIAVTEAVRMKCGSREGLLPMLLTPFEWVGSWLAQWEPSHAKDTTEAASAPEMKTREEMMEERIREASTVDESGNTSIDYAQLQQMAPQPPKPYEALFDPSFTDEGFSWCLDLTLPDSTFLLPTSLALFMAFNIIFRPRIAPVRPRTPHQTVDPAIKDHSANQPDLPDPVRKSLSSPAPRTLAEKLNLPPITNLQRIGLSISLVFWFAALKMPAAILLYFVPSLVVGWVQRQWLEQRMPVRGAVQPCRRPLRWRARRDWTG